MAAVKRVLVYGGKGALGRACVSAFKKNNYWVASVDLLENEEADVNVLVSANDSWTAQEEKLVGQVGQLLGDSKLEAVLCVAGGWAGGSAASSEFVKNAELMVSQSIASSILAARLASKYLADGGLLTLTGAKAALGATPGMIGYGLAKAAVHQLVSSLGDPKGGLPTNSAVVGILPITLDTPMNRKFMPNADFSTWTPLEYVSDLFIKWTSNQERPPSGSLIQMITEGGKTNLVPV